MTKTYTMFYPINQNTIDKIKSQVESAHTILIIGHTSPDPDAVSSVLSLYVFFKKKYPQKNIIPALPDDLPTNVFWFEHVNDIKLGQQVVPYFKTAQVIFLVDLNEAKRVGELEQYLRQSSAFKIIIDHHPEPEQFANILISYPEAASTTEIIFTFVHKYDSSLIDKQIATYIFTGLLTDTGCFCHDSANERSFAVASELLKYKIDKNRIIQEIYNNYSYDRMRLMGYVLVEKMKIIPEYNFGYISLSLEEMRRFNYKYGDHENFVNLPLSIKGITFSAMFMEQEKTVRVSLRSTGSIDVGMVAKKYLNGGGHKNAAGGNMDLPLQNAVNKFINEILPKIFENEQVND